MEALAPEIEEFLSVVSWVIHLDEMDTALAAAGRSLWARLAWAEDEGDAGIYDLTLQQLDRVGLLRGEITRELQIARTKGQLQVLGTANAV